MKELWYEKYIKGERKNRKYCTLERLTDMYFIRLVDKACRLFTFDGLPFPQHELQFRAVLQGYAGVVNDQKRGIMTAWGGMSGSTQYTDYFKKFTYAAPTAKGGTLEIGKECVILRNTSLSESMFTYIQRYAELYAHNDLSLRIALVNSRYQDILKTTNPANADTIEDWYSSLHEGKALAIIDDSPMSEFLDSSGSISALNLTRTGDVDFTRFTELENELTRAFYRDLGVRWNKDKKANLVSGEVEQDNMLLQYNVSDMLKCREEFCEEYNRVFDAPNISVRLTIDIERSEENVDNIGLSGNDNSIDSVSGIGE